MPVQAKNERWCEAEAGAKVRKRTLRYANAIPESDESKVQEKKHKINKGTKTGS